MSEDLRDKIIRHEGFTSIPKPDAKGFWEVGFGHDITAEQAKNEYADGVTTEEALNLLDADIARCVDQASEQIPCYDRLNEARQDTIVEMVYQLGINGVLKFKDMLSALDAGDYEKAGAEMVNSEWYRETPSRCEELSAIMISGQD